MKSKVALFDFDDTLIHGDSGRLLLKYYIKKHPLSFFRIFIVGFYFILYLLHLCPINKPKSAWLFPMDKMTNQQLQEFYNECLVPRYYDNVVARLKELKNDGYTVYICSASIEGYLRYCDLPVDALLGTIVEIKNNRYTSKMLGKNCKREEKVKRINEQLAKDNLEIDYDNSYAFSDSHHDIPMLKMVKNRIKIDTKDGHMSPFIIKE